MLALAMHSASQSFEPDHFVDGRQVLRMVHGVLFVVTLGLKQSPATVKVGLRLLYVQ